MSASAVRRQYLVVRPDRLGDVLLSTPVLSALRQLDPDAWVTWVVQPAILPVVQGLPELHASWAYDPQGMHAGFRGFLRLWKQVRAGQFDVAIVLQTQWKIGLVVFLAGIPRRIGPWSKLHSYLFYNLGLRQKRSQVKMHEAQYNLELLSLLNLGPVLHPGGTKAVLLLEDQSEARMWLESQGWQASDSWVAVHPGMGGSALNWPERYYIELIEKLRDSGHHVLVTAGVVEEKLLQRIEESLKNTPRGLTRMVLFCAGGQNPRRLVRSIGFLGGLYQLMRLVVAPSTGPLHLAVGLGIPVVALYPPIRVQSPARWGPFSEKMEQIKVLVPEVQCPATFHCWGERCSFYPCMESLGVDPVLTQIQTLLKEEGLSHG